MRITFARPLVTDVPQLVDIQIRAFHDDTRLYGVELGGPPGYDSIEALTDKLDKYLCHKVMCDDKIVGDIIVFDRGDGHYHLDVLVIDPDYHNQGIGSAAMKFLETTYPAVKWTLDTPLYAVRNQHFYEKFGYQKIEEFDADDIILIAYEKQLA